MIHTTLTYDVELNQGITQRRMPQALLSHDSQAHRLCIRCTRDGQPAQLDGAAVTGYFIRQDGSTVPMTGQAAGSQATCTLPAGCYACDGRFSLVIKLNQGDAVNTIFWGVGDVVSSRTDRLADNERLLPSLSELLAQIDAMEAAGESAGEAAAKANASAKAADTAAARADAAAETAAAAAGQAGTTAAKAEKVACMTAKATTLEAGRQATASYGDGVLSLGIPRGADGKGIASSTIAYQAGNSPTAAPAGTWVDTPPATSAARPYLWTRTLMTYTDGKTAAAYSVSSSMDSVQVGGRNLLTGSTLTDDSQGVRNWPMYTHNSVPGKEYTEDGLHFTTDETGVGNSNGPGFGFFRDALGLKTGDTVTFSADVKGQPGTGAPNLGYWASKPDNKDSYAYIVSGPRLESISAEAFTRVSMSVTLQDLYEGNQDDSFGIHGGFNADLYVKNIKLERGNTATDWTPAPEDVDAAISAKLSPEALNIRNGKATWSLRGPNAARESDGYALGVGAIATGADTRASGPFSRAEGYKTTASGYYSHAEGEGTIASGYRQHVEGAYNLEDTTGGRYIHIVGNGESDQERSNACTLDAYGNAWLKGTLYLGGADMDDRANAMTPVPRDYKMNVLAAEKSNAAGHHALICGSNAVADADGHYRFIVGIGTNNPENGFTVDEEGSVWLRKKLYVGGAYPGNATYELSARLTELEQRLLALETRFPA